MSIFDNVLENIKLQHYTENTIRFLDEKLNDEDVIKLSEALKFNPHIRKVVLDVQNIGYKGVIALSEVPTITCLSLAWISSATRACNITHIGAEALAKSGLQKLDISGNHLIGDKGMQFLSRNKTIIELYIAGCGISSQGAAEFFKINNTVKRLDLTSNKIQDAGLNTISLNHKVEELKLSDCAITECGVELIAKNDSLKLLSLPWNKLKGSNWAVSLAKHPKLIRLNLRGCDLEYTAVQILVNSKLKYLSLDDNEINCSAIKASTNTSRPIIELRENTGKMDITTWKKIKDMEHLINIRSSMSGTYGS